MMDVVVIASVLVSMAAALASVVFMVRTFVHYLKTSWADRRYRAAVRRDRR